MQTVTEDPLVRWRRPVALDVEIVIPVYNEERVLAATVYRLHDFLSRQLPFSWQITIADSASTDLTGEIAEALADGLDRVHMLRLEAKGRGRALRAAWSASSARVVAYMDVDLSTDLRGLLPLLAPLMSGHSLLATGSRLAPTARIARGAKREFISRAYNLILRTVLRAGFSDAQCGFKAVRADALAALLPSIRDESWFFDTELLVLAQRRGMRIHEVPVDWVDDPDSRVDIVSTALEDLRGVARLALTAVANTAANRRITFGVRSRKHLGRQHFAAFMVFMIALGLTNGALAVLHVIDPHPVRLIEAAALVVANLAATVTRYVALTTWVFRARTDVVAAGGGRCPSTRSVATRSRTRSR